MYGTISHAHHSKIAHLTGVAAASRKVRDAGDRFGPPHPSPGRLGLLLDERHCQGCLEVYLEPVSSLLSTGVSTPTKARVLASEACESCFISSIDFETNLACHVYSGLHQIACCKSWQGTTQLTYLDTVSRMSFYHSHQMMTGHSSRSSTADVNGG